MVLRVKHGFVTFHCPSCKCAHRLPVGNADSQHAFSWKWDGNEQRPTIQPSIRVSDSDGTICHLNVTDGMLCYHGDMPGDYRGKQIPMVDFYDIESI